MSSLRRDEETKYGAGKNVPLFYKRKYELACELHLSGKTDAALDIAFGIIEEPDVGLYRRAVVNLFISKVADFFYLNQAGYAFECLDLLERLRETTAAGSGASEAGPTFDAAATVSDLLPGAEKAIKEIEDQAVARIYEIYRMALRVAKKGARAKVDGTDNAMEDDGDISTEKDISILNAGQTETSFQIIGMFTRQGKTSTAKGDDTKMPDKTGQTSGEETEADDIISGLPQQFANLETSRTGPADD